MPELKAFYQPRTFAEAQMLLKEHGDHARPLAGGTSLVLSKSSRLEVLVDLRNVGLDHLEEQDDGLHIGPMVTCTALRQYLVNYPDSLLAEAAASIGSRVLQNQITVGGNCVMIYAWSDFPVALWCLDAQFVIQANQAPKHLTANAFFAEHPLQLMEPGELLVDIIVPPPEVNTGSAYLKMGRNATDQSLASAAVKVTLENQKIKKARIVVGAVRGLPQLLQSTTQELQDKEPTSETLQQAASSAAAEIMVNSDYRASAEYRKVLVSCLVEDALNLAVRRAGGAQ